jgi:hypothetical protein
MKLPKYWPAIATLILTFLLAMTIVVLFVVKN